MRGRATGDQWDVAEHPTMYKRQSVTIKNYSSLSANSIKVEKLWFTVTVPKSEPFTQVEEPFTQPELFQKMGRVKEKVHFFLTLGLRAIIILH